MKEKAATDEVQYLGFQARFVAFMIDSTVASIIMAPFVSQLVGELVLSDYDLSDQAQMIELLQRLTTQLSVDLLFMGTIFVLFWIFKNATPGKMIFKSVIVDANTLCAPTVTQNIIRYLGYFVSLFPLGIGFLWIAFDKRKQGWHDKLAGTVVIRGKPATRDEAQSGDGDGNG